MRFVLGGAVVSSLCTRLPGGTFERSETVLKFKGHPIYRQLT